MVNLEVRMKEEIDCIIENCEVKNITYTEVINELFYNSKYCLRDIEKLSDHIKESLLVKILKEEMEIFMKDEEFWDEEDFKSYIEDLVDNNQYDLYETYKFTIDKNNKYLLVNALSRI